MPNFDKIREQFRNNGYAELPGYKVPKSLPWQPNLVFSKDGHTYLVLVKSNNAIPPAYLNRIAILPKGNFIPLIVFAQKPTTNDEKSILSLGISIGRLVNGKLSHLKIKKKIPQIIVQREIKKKLEVIDLFVSSKQDIAERKFVEERIEYLRKANSYPFNPPHLIEYDHFNLKKLYKHIDMVIGNCEWIVIVLEDNYSEVVSYEILKAIKTIRHENIFMFIKSTNLCKTTWKKELNKIKKLEGKSIKYLPYSNLNELEVLLSKAIHTRINEICKRKKIEIFQ